METSSPLAAIYRRLSKDRDEQTSTARQEADCRKAAAVDGATVAEVFTDLVSGYRADVGRPGFEKAVSWVTSSPGRTLYVWKLDRLSRRGIGQVGEVLDRLEAVGSRVVFVQDGLDSSVQGHRMVIAILSEQARQESANTSTRTRSALAHRKASGLWPGGRPPYGFRIATRSLKPGNDPASFVETDEVEPGRLVVDPETGPVLRDAVGRIISGASLYEVTKWLVESGATTARGGTWRTQTLSTLLRSPALVGWLPAKKGATEPARDPETREPVVCGEALLTLAERRRLLRALEARSAAPRRGKGRGAGRKPRSLLTGVVRCGACGSAMTGGGTPPNERYACALRATGGDCPGNTVTQRGADDHVTQRVLSRWAAMEPDDPVLLDVAGILLGRPVVDPLGTAERDALEAELAEHQARLDDLAALRLDPEFRGAEGAERYARLRDPLLDAIERTASALREARANEPDLGALLDPAELREGWDSLNIDARRAALAASIDRVEVRKAEKTGQRWDPERRLHIVWSEASAPEEVAS
ncbi:recombinase family protein [Nitriliruptor alkaliphilus]|uniref:recombinase family protein n=1 Tax=Nitriliruptor alkaliphilus TaxID=427918 RepID=UPI0006986D84|nr:recombinase family protein [Nitriliruptor alkaliphilus]